MIADEVIRKLALYEPAGPIRSLVIAASFASASIALRVALNPVFADTSGLLLLLPGILLASLMAGTWAGIATLLLSYFGAWALASATPLLPVDLATNPTRYTVITLVSLFAVLISTSLRRTIRDLQTSFQAQQEAATRLDESEDRFQQIADIAPAMLWTADAKGRVYVNAEFLKFWGERPMGDASAMPWLEAVHPEDRQRVLHASLEALNERKALTIEARYRRGDGAWRILSTHAKPRLGPDGSFMGMVGANLDVTEARETTASIAERERRQKFLIDLLDTLRTHDDPRAIAEQLVRALSTEFDGCVVGLAEPEGDEWSIMASDTDTPLARAIRGGLPHAVISRIDQGQVVVVHDAADAIDYVDLHVQGVRGFALVPLLRQERLQALVYVDAASSKQWCDLKSDLLVEAAERSWSEIERARAEAALRESEARFRDVADTAPVLIWVTRQDRTRAFVNKAYVAFNGGTYEEALDANWREAIHPDDQDRIIRESLAGEASCQPFPLEARYRRADGTWRWLRSLSHPRLTPSGEVIGFVGVAYDITETRETNEQLSRLAREREAILGQLAEGVIVTDAVGRITFVNEAARRIHGVETLGVGPDGYVEAYALLTEHGQPHPTETLPLVRAVRNGETLTDARWRIRRPDGSEVLAVGNARPLLDSEGATFGAVLTLRDETARISAENRLSESEMRFRTVSDSAPVMIWKADEAHRMVFANRRFRTFYGHDDLEALPEVALGMVHPDDRDQARTMVREAFDRLDRFDMTVRVVHPEMGERWLRCEGVPRFDASGGFQGYVGANFDVTEVKHAEGELKRINELLEERVSDALNEKARAEADLMHAQRIEALGRLTGGVAHDFNNLLTVIIGALDMVLKSPGDTARSQRLAEAALSAARRGERLTNQLLAFSRRQTLRPEVVDLNALVRETEPLLRKAVTEDVILNLTMGRAAIRANVDPAQFEAALLNLIVNAGDAVSARGNIHVAIARRTLETAQGNISPGDYAVVSVSDDGTGMSEDVLERVFEPFFTTKAVGKGTGLGLSQVYGFARQSGGGVEIDSREGEGTRVSLYLPLVEAVQKRKTTRAAPRDSEPDVDIRGREVLLVEDDEAVASVAIDVLESLGLEVEHVTSASAALERVEARRFDLMISDIIMPGGQNGVELANHVAREHPYLRIILMSGYAGDAFDKQLEQSSWPFLRKPYTAHQLRSSARQELARPARTRARKPAET